MMRHKLYTFVVIVAFGLTSAGCQLLVDRRNHGKASVVVVPLDEWDYLRNSQTLASADVAIQPEIIPLEGSQKIEFSSQTNSQLAGCSTFGIIEVQHAGSMDEAIVILKNEAFRLNTNILVPVHSKQSVINITAPQKIAIEARMMKCPLKLARGN